MSTCIRRRWNFVFQTMRRSIRHCLKLSGARWRTKILSLKYRCRKKRYGNVKTSRHRSRNRLSAGVLKRCGVEEGFSRRTYSREQADSPVSLRQKKMKTCRQQFRCRAQHRRRNQHRQKTFLSLTRFFQRKKQLSQNSPRTGYRKAIHTPFPNPYRSQYRRIKQRQACQKRQRQLYRSQKSLTSNRNLRQSPKVFWQKMPRRNTRSSDSCSILTGW